MSETPRITRRELLKRAAAVAGAALVTPSVFSSPSKPGGEISPEAPASFDEQLRDNVARANGQITTLLREHPEIEDARDELVREFNTRRASLITLIVRNPRLASEVIFREPLAGDQQHQAVLRNIAGEAMESRVENLTGETLLNRPGHAEGYPTSVFLYLANSEPDKLTYHLSGEFFTNEYIKNLRSDRISVSGYKIGGVILVDSVTPLTP